LEKILVIKTGAAGDVVRTSVLLNALFGKVTWLTEAKYKDLFPESHPWVENILPVAEWTELKFKDPFDLVISLEEDLRCATIASKVPSRKLTGVYAEGNTLNYTADSACWFDLGLLSKQGLEIANSLKAKNTLAYQQLLFTMIGMKFNGEKYVVYKNPTLNPTPGVIGLERRAGKRWNNKIWSGYDHLAAKLSASGYKIKFLGELPSIKAYLDDIARCTYVISGDTLAMHIALAYQRPCIAIFNCTSPAEIFDYGLLRKIISPRLEKYFYKRGFDEDAVNAISVEEVESVVKSSFR
jgi:heptosyltransferase II